MSTKRKESPDVEPVPEPVPSKPVATIPVVSVQIIDGVPKRVWTLPPKAPQ